MIQTVYYFHLQNTDTVAYLERIDILSACFDLFPVQPDDGARLSVFKGQFSHQCHCLASPRVVDNRGSGTPRGSSKFFVR